MVKAICAEPHLRDADLFLFQEVCRDSGKASVADEVAGRLGFSACFAESPDATDQGLAIVSRFPIVDMKADRLDSCNLRFRYPK